MNLPNKLTILRVLMIPAFVVLMILGEYFQNNMYYYWADVVFVLAALTDMLDGRIARKYNLITNFGKFMDPLADKLLVCSAIICLVDIGRMPAWACILIVAREFTISGFRLVASDRGIVIAASYWGKFKTVFQMLMVIFMVANLDFIWFTYITQALMYIAIVLTVVSLIDYIYKNKSVLKEQA